MTTPAREHRRTGMATPPEDGDRKYVPRAEALEIAEAALRDGNWIVTYGTNGDVGVQRMPRRHSPDPVKPEGRG